MRLSATATQARSRCAVAAARCTTASTSVRSVVTHVKDRLEESETLQQQAQNNSLAQFSASPDLQTEFVGAVIGAMDSSDRPINSDPQQLRDLPEAHG